MQVTSGNSEDGKQILPESLQKAHGSTKPRGIRMGLHLSPKDPFQTSDFQHYRRVSFVVFSHTVCDGWLQWP